MNREIGNYLSYDARDSIVFFIDSTQARSLVPSFVIRVVRKISRRKRRVL